jgi:hypothetical protein
MDWAVIHDLNELMRTQDALEDSVVLFASAAVVVYALATIALWFAARPAGVQRFRLACTASLGSAAVGLLVNQLIGHLWFRDRPYDDHPGSLVLFTAPSHDPFIPERPRDRGVRDRRRRPLLPPPPRDRLSSRRCGDRFLPRLDRDALPH